jgi:hypothetical protein
LRGRNWRSSRGSPEKRLKWDEPGQRLDPSPLAPRTLRKKTFHASPKSPNRSEKGRQLVFCSIYHRQRSVSCSFGKLPDEKEASKRKQNRKRFLFRALLCDASPPEQPDINASTRQISLRSQKSSFVSHEQKTRKQVFSF